MAVENRVGDVLGKRKAPAPVRDRLRRITRVTLHTGRSRSRRVLPAAVAIALGGVLPAQGASDPATPATVTITGEVCDVLGTPLVGATVVVRRAGDDALLHRAATDGTGVFVLQVPTRERVRVVTSAAGHATWAPVVEPGDPIAFGWLTRIVLEDGIDLVGTVRDLAGRPVAARIITDAIDGTADADGAFVLRGMRIGRVPVTAYAAGHRLASACVDTSDAPKFDFVLAPEVDPPLVVRLSDGVDRERTMVEISIPGRDLPRALREPRLDAEGRAEVHGLERGLVLLHLRERTSGRILGHRGVTLTGAAATIELVPTAAATALVTGRLRRAEGEPLGGIALTLNHGSPDSATRAVTAADGTFRCEMPGGWQPPMYATLDDPAWILVAAQRGLSIPPKAAAPTFELSAIAACAVLGKVLDPEGNPVPFALLNLSAPPGTPGHTTRGIDLCAGPDGTFAFRGLSEANADLTLIASTPRHAARVDDIAIPTPGARAWVTVQLAAAAEVIGVVQDSNGDALASGGVRVPRISAPRAGFREGHAVPFAQAITKRDGRFRVRGLPPGRYRLYLSSAKPNDPPTIEFSLEAGQVRDMGVLTAR